MSDELPSYAPADSGAGDEDQPARVKLYRINLDHVYLDTLLAKAMIATLEKSRSSMGFVLSHLVEQYHLQMRDEVANPRPPRWPAKFYLTHSAFKSEAEWQAYEDSSKNAGLSSEARPDTGLPPHLQRWGQLKHDKWKVIRSDILNDTHVEWARLFPNGELPSGKFIWQMVEKLRLVLFKIWMLAPVKKGGFCNYKAQQMPEDYIPFNVWHLWVKIGPAGGQNKSTVFIDECCTPIQPITLANGANTDEQPDEITQLNLAASKTRFTSREAERIANKLKQGVKSELSFTSPRNDSDAFKRQRQIQHDTISQLTLLSKSPHATDLEKLGYSKRLYEYIKSITVVGCPDTGSSSSGGAKEASTLTLRLSPAPMPMNMFPSPLLNSIRKSASSAVFQKGLSMIWKLHPNLC